MTKATAPTALLALLLLFGCASSRPSTTADAPTAADTTGSVPDTTQAADTTRAATATADSQATSRDTTTARTDLSEAPRDWYHRGSDARPFHGLATQTAYRTLLEGRSPRDTVVVAIIDSGIDSDHEDLVAERWTNADEVPGNNKDDDGNGYVDDVHGWNFIGGPDGENVNQDTYELTRIYVDLRERFGDVDSTEVAPEHRDAYRRFLRIRRTFREKRSEAQKQLRRVRKTRDAVRFARSTLTDRLGTDSLSREAVESVAATEQDVQRAQDILLYFYRQDLSPQDVFDYYDYVERKVEYNYNPDFNPRPIVGDDYSDKTERHYGNSDVKGPDANHGTHVAGIIGATRTNNLGTKGVARGVRLMSIRAVPNGDERDKDIANAIRYAVDNGADIINMSFGKGYSPHKAVVDAAVRHADSMGVLMVHAAGNDGANVDTTENYPTDTYASGGEASLWIEVGASSWKGGGELAAPFSNYGRETVDVFAPGQSIYSTVPNDQYGRNSGTSMAAPMVSGLAAMVMAYYPDLSAHQVRDIILESAVRHSDAMVTRPGSSDQQVPFGRLSRTGAIVNAAAALRHAQQASTRSSSTR